MVTDHNNYIMLINIIYSTINILLICINKSIYSVLAEKDEKICGISKFSCVRKVIGNDYGSYYYLL